MLFRGKVLKLSSLCEKIEILNLEPHFKQNVKVSSLCEKIEILNLEPHFKQNVKQRCRPCVRRSKF